MELTLTRTTRRRGYTEGVLTDENGKHLADTLEPQWRALDKGEKKVYSERVPMPEEMQKIIPNTNALRVDGSENGLNKSLEDWLSG